jgi:hypothetical protein
MTFRQLWCSLLRRHEWRLHWHGPRMYQQCTRCRRERPGWAIDVDPKLQDQREVKPDVKP